VAKLRGSKHHTLKKIINNKTDECVFEKVTESAEMALTYKKKERKSRQIRRGKPRQ
jgi:hypothetical protein